MPSRKATLVSAIVVVLLVAVGVAALQLRDGGATSPGATPPATSTPTAAPTATPPATTAPTVAPSTPTDAPSPDDAATDPARDDTETEGGPAPTGGAVDVVITYAGWTAEGTGVEVSAYAAAVEGAGSCTLTLSKKGTTPRTQTIDALVDVSTMSCGGFLIPAGEVPSGTWTAVVAYSSATSTGQSNPTEVVVP